MSPFPICNSCLRAINSRAHFALLRLARLWYAERCLNAAQSLLILAEEHNVPTPHGYYFSESLEEDDQEPHEPPYEDWIAIFRYALRNLDRCLDLRVWICCVYCETENRLEELVEPILLGRVALGDGRRREDICNMSLLESVLDDAGAAVRWLRAKGIVIGGM